MQHERTDGHGTSDDGSTSVLAEAAAVNLPPELAAGRLLIVGGGYCGSRLARRVRAGGGAVQVTHRRPAAADDLVLDDSTGQRPDPARLAATTHLLVTAAPAADGLDPVLRLLQAELVRWPLRWVGVLSSTGVYGDSGGAWVDEDTPLPGAGAGRSASRRRCEDHWRSLGGPLQILRLPGIYGPGRNPLAGLRGGEARLVHKPGQVFSRVHVDDIVGAILHNLGLPTARRPTLLNVADRRPAPSSEVLGFAAHLLGVPLPPFQWYAEAEAGMGPMARSFWQDNRRVSSRRLTDDLGYRLRYPTFREGLRGCLREEGLPDPRQADHWPADPRPVDR